MHSVLGGVARELGAAAGSQAQGPDSTAFLILIIVIVVLVVGTAGFILYLLLHHHTRKPPPVWYGPSGAPRPPVAAQRCPACGHEATPGARVCVRCGATLPGSPPPVS